MSFKYVTDPYFKPLKVSEKFIIETYMDYYRRNYGDKNISSRKVIEEILCHGIKLLQDDYKSIEFRKILDKVLESLQIDEIDINDSTSKFIYIKIMYDIYKDETNELKKMLVDNIYKEKELYYDLLNLSVSYAIEYDAGEKNTLKSIDIVIKAAFKKYTL